MYYTVQLQAYNLWKDENYKFVLFLKIKGIQDNSFLMGGEQLYFQFPASNVWYMQIMMKQTGTNRCH